MTLLHLVISVIFFMTGFLMRYGLAHGLVKFCYNKIPQLSRQEYDEIIVRRFVGETSIKLGSFIFIIAMVGFFVPGSFKIAMVFGWACFAITAFGSVSFFDKINIIKKIKENVR